MDETGRMARELTQDFLVGGELPSLVAAYEEFAAKAIAAERARCLRIVEERCEGDMDFAAFLIKRTETAQQQPNAADPEVNKNGA